MSQEAHYKVLSHVAGRVISRVMGLNNAAATAIHLGLLKHPGGYRINLGYGEETVIHIEEVK